MTPLKGGVNVGVAVGVLVGVDVRVGVGVGAAVADEHTASNSASPSRDNGHTAVTSSRCYSNSGVVNTDDAAIDSQTLEQKLDLLRQYADTVIAKA
jgi:hypothetical protein